MLDLDRTDNGVVVQHPLYGLFFSPLFAIHTDVVLKKIPSLHSSKDGFYQGIFIQDPAPPVFDSANRKATVDPE